jgi:hypothetical protein
MDSKGDGFARVNNPETLRDILLDKIRPKLAHDAGTAYANAASVCWQRREWKILKDWQLQDIFRREVIQPLSKDYQ